MAAREPDVVDSGGLVVVYGRETDRRILLDPHAIEALAEAILHFRTAELVAMLRSAAKKAAVSESTIQREEP